MLDVGLLGTGGMMPLPRRRLTSCMLRYNGNSLLIDCGEGTQTALREMGWSFKPVNTILLTHLHADHVAGLPGFLLTVGNADRTEPLTIIGPKGTERLVRAVRVIAPELHFEVRTMELAEQKEQFVIDGIKITAFKVRHNITCYGYRFDIDRQGRFDAARAKAQNIPLALWNPLQKGQTIEQDGIVYTPSMVLGEARKGISFVYTTDTRPTPMITDVAKDADLMIAEGMYGGEGMEEKAKEHRHMTMQECAKLAAEADVGELWFTHYSPSMMRPEQYMDEVRAIFPRAKAGRDGDEITLRFEDEA